MKHILSAMTVTALMLSSSAALAASTGTITFNGELTDTTCEVDISGMGSDATIILPSVGVNQLTRSGDTSGRTSFNMKVSGCVMATGHSMVSAFFQAGTTVDLSTGRLKNMTGSATNVDLRLLDASNSFAPINAGSSDQVDGTSYVYFDIDGIDMESGHGIGSALLPYAVEYYANGQTTPGTVASSIVYTLQYK